MRSVCRLLAVWTIAGLNAAALQASAPEEPEPLARPIPTSVEHRVLLASNPQRARIITGTDDLGDPEVQVTDGTIPRATRALHRKPAPPASTRAMGQRTTHLGANATPCQAASDCAPAASHRSECSRGSATCSAMGRLSDGEACAMCGDGGTCCGFDCDGCGRVNCLSCLRGWLGNGLRGDHWYNCQCSGSYKFPVPPQYTYHWPGLYSHRLMTDYHSPWRFPPLKPFTDEPSAETLAPLAIAAPRPAQHAVTAVRTAAPLTDYTLSTSPQVEQQFGAVHAATFSAPLSRSAEEALRSARAATSETSFREAEPVSRKLERWYGNR